MWGGGKKIVQNCVTSFMNHLKGEKICETIHTKKVYSNKEKVESKLLSINKSYLENNANWKPLKGVKSVKSFQARRARRRNGDKNQTLNVSAPV